MIDYFTSPAFYETLIVALIGVLFIMLTSAIDRKFLKSKSANGRWYRSAKMIIDFINTVVVIILILIILSINGFNVAKYVTSLGVIGIILSFALQDLLKDITMGTSIMFEGYFKVGDCVLYQGRQGKVVSFNVKTTKIFMLDTESTLSVCNRNISQIEVDSDWIDILVPIGYDVDLYFSRMLCREAAKKIERLRYVYSCDFLNTQDLGESSIIYKLRVHCLTEKKIPVRRNALAVVQDVFHENGASFPYNVLILHDGDKPADKKVRDKVGTSDAEIMEPGTDKTVISSRKRKYDYEFGRGAAKSKVCVYDGSDDSISKAVAEAERYAGSENLDNGMKLRLRLLSEELLSLTKGLPSIKNGSFYIERDGGDYDICLEADAKIGKKTREKLVEVSSSNTNDAYTGLSGLVSQAIDSMILMSINDKSGVNKVSMNTMEESIGKADDDYRWSYNVYKEREMLQGEDSDELVVNEDEIVRSVLTSLSDDIKISVRTNHVSFRVLVKNEDED